jgi:hypothetical protein
MGTSIRVSTTVWCEGVLITNSSRIIPGRYKEDGFEGLDVVELQIEIMELITTNLARSLTKDPNRA